MAFVFDYFHVPLILHVNMENRLFPPPPLLSSPLQLFSDVGAELGNTKGFPALSFHYIAHLWVEFLKLSSSKHLECLKFKKEAECFCFRTKKVFHITKRQIFLWPFCQAEKWFGSV